MNKKEVRRVAVMLDDAIAKNQTDIEERQINMAIAHALSDIRQVPTSENVAKLENLIASETLRRIRFFYEIFGPVFSEIKDFESKQTKGEVIRKGITLQGACRIAQSARTESEKAQREYMKLMEDRERERENDE